jgi:hypothetical protein
MCGSAMDFEWRENWVQICVLFVWGIGLEYIFALPVGLVMRRDSTQPRV